MKTTGFVVATLAIALSTPALAQPRDRRDAGRFRSEVRLQGYVFGNFFQAADPDLEEDVSAAAIEYRAALRPWASPTDFYANVDFMRYENEQRPNTYGWRLGVQHSGDVHAYSAYVDRGENRASFEVGDTTATANITTLGGEYSYRITPDWQVGAEVLQERERYDVESSRENDFTAVGASVRYRGFGRSISPEVGFVSGNRDVVDPDDSYDDDYWYVRVVSSPIPRLYLSLRYRQRQREYTTSNVADSNFGRADERHGWVLTSNFQFTDRLGTLLYYTTEDVDTNRPGRDFDRSTLLLGVTYGF
jgi:hypothetical protein